MAAKNRPEVARMQLTFLSIEQWAGQNASDAGPQRHVSVCQGGRARELQRRGPGPGAADVEAQSTGERAREAARRAAAAADDSPGDGDRNRADVLPALRGA